MPALIVATLQATIVLAIGIWAYQIPFAGSLLLFYFTMVIYGLSLVGFGLLISSLCATQQQAFIGVFVFMMPAILLSGYVSPVENMPQWLQDLTSDKSHPPLYRYHQANLSEGCESGDCVGKFVAATGHSGHHRLSGVCDVPKEDCVIPVIVQTTTALAFLTHPSRIVIYASGDSLRCRLVVARTL